MSYFNNTKDFLIALKGERGPQGEASRWYCGTGTVPNGQGVMVGSSIANAKPSDMYLNTETGDVYRCTTGGSWVEARWRHECNIKGSSDSGGTNFTTDKTLTLKDGILSVNTVDKLNDETADNTLPITAAAVNVTVGNIEVLLQTI